ncbi:MAG: GDSL-type esterase/lipase family protein [Lachnospiraceae bacterium]
MEQILCFGDSNTYGLVPGKSERFGWNVRWTGILEENIREKGYRVIEEGLCGRTTIFDDPVREGRKGVALLPTILETHNPVKLVILMLGTNDCKVVYDAPAELIGKGVEKLIGQIRAKDENIKILLISPIALGDGVWEEGFDPEFDADSIIRSKRLPEIYRQIAARQGVEFLAASDYAWPSKEDREHLDKYGHTSLANAVIDKVSEILAL